MSERDGFRPSTGSLFLFLVIVVALAMLLGELGSELRDLQRRVGQLEEQVKR